MPLCSQALHFPRITLFPLAGLRKAQSLHHSSGPRLQKRKPLSVSVGFPHRYLSHPLPVPGEGDRRASYPYSTDGETEAGSDLTPVCQGPELAAVRPRPLSGAQQHRVPRLPFLML